MIGMPYKIKSIVTRKLEGVNHFHNYLCRQLKGGGMEIYIAIGMVGDLLFVVFTERGENIRLISARLATESERRLYYDQNFYN